MTDLINLYNEISKDAINYHNGLNKTPEIKKNILLNIKKCNEIFKNDDELNKKLILREKIRGLRLLLS